MEQHDSPSAVPKVKSCKDAAEAVNFAVQETIQAAHREAVEALRELVTWVPGFRDDVPLAYGTHLSNEDAIAERERCDQAPMMTEAWAYEMFGKDEARTFLIMVKKIAKALGTDINELQNDPEQYHGKYYVSPIRQGEIDRHEQWITDKKAARLWWNAQGNQEAATFFSLYVRLPEDTDVSRDTLSGRTVWSGLTGQERAAVTEAWIQNIKDKD